MVTGGRDWTRGMSPEIATAFRQQPPELQRAYLAFYAERRMRKAAHRDTLESFIAGWTMRGQATTRVRRQAAA